MLLAARNGHGALFQVVLDLVKQRCPPEGFFHNLVQLGAAADAMGTRAVGNVVIDGHGEGVGLLEHHAYPFAQQVHIHAGGKDVLPVQMDIAGDAAAGDQVVHPVEGFEQRGLAAAGRPDQGGYLPHGDFHVDIFQRMKGGIVQVHPLDVKLDILCVEYLC